MFSVIFAARRIASSPARETASLEGGPADEHLVADRPDGEDVRALVCGSDSKRERMTVRLSSQPRQPP
jgi:hypothetical protein